jgi:hypothetical protein
LKPRGQSAQGARHGGVQAACANGWIGQVCDAEDLVWHSIAVVVLFGLVLTVTVLIGGPWLYDTLGGRGGSLAAVLTNFNVIFSVAIWLFNSLANVIRGTGNMHVPALVTSGGTFGPGAIARYGVGSRLEYLLVPLALYFASQGFGRLRWAVVANLTGRAIAVGGGWHALLITGDFTFVFIAVA